MTQPDKKDYVAIANKYARDVVDGRIDVCKWVKLACARHLRNLEQAAAGWQYTFDPELTDKDGKTFRPVYRICRFAELMPHIKGEWAGRGDLIRLQPWQVFVLASIFGWIDVETLRRRFRVADIFVPRKNAKSTLGAIIGLYMLTVDGEFGAEVYSGATSEDQAFEVFRPAFLMARASEKFRRRYDVSVPTALRPTNISVLSTNSKFEPLIGKPGDGASPSCVIVDEYHEHKTSELYDAEMTGMGARAQPLMVVITTSGSSIGGPCHQHQLELQKILEGVVENERRFGIIYGLDEDEVKDEAWTEPESMAKANPNFGVSVYPEYLEQQVRDAIADPRKQSIVKTKHFNIWVGAASPWLNLLNLQKCGDPTLKLDQFRGEQCWHGLDLASKSDIASDVYIFRRVIAGRNHYYVFSKNYLPEAALKREENAHYRGWEAQGYLIQTPGNMIELNVIRENVEASAEDHVIVEVAMDAWGSREIAPKLIEEGFVVVDIPMTTSHLSEPMKTIAGLIDGGELHHDGNPAFVWMLSNVEVYPDRNENIFPRKSAPEKKIDAAVGLIVGMNRALVSQPVDLSGFLANPVVVG